MKTDFGELAPGVAVHDPIVITRPYRDSVNGQLEPNVRIGAHSRVDSFVKIEGGEGVAIGTHVHVASFCHLNIGGGRLVVGDGAALASGCRVITGSNHPDAESCSASAPAAQQLVSRSAVVIAKNACLFAGVTVLPGVTVGEGARVAAGSVVTKDVPPFEIWAGVPARFKRLRRDDAAVARLDSWRENARKERE